ncbi:MAG: hypothetical protein KME29_31700 [Calothrix sp. FI2-JRJ7]|nr:hypothetical protein [Calothrix sp. FI2-JRJ7]
MTKPVSRRKVGQLSVRLDENLLKEYKNFLEAEGMTLTEDIESYIKSRLSKIKSSSNVVDINSFNELAKKVLVIEEQLGKLQAS